MGKAITAIYEKGLIKPLEKLDLKEYQKIKVTIEVFPSVVKKTKSIIKAKPDVVKEVAENDEYLTNLKS
ncbi:MAG TPA: DUF104 domain-containing protein [Syntrophaceae bacterium]|nr:DUF104 domain-containing protein [Syntrophaceae bacterium]